MPLMMTAAFAFYASLAVWLALPSARRKINAFLSMPEPSHHNRLPALDGVRGLAALWVALFHVWQWTQPTFNKGRRFLRIYPLYFVSAMLALALFPPSNLSFGRVVSEILMLRSFGYPLVLTAWFVPAVYVPTLLTIGALSLLLDRAPLSASRTSRQIHRPRRRGRGAHHLRQRRRIVESG